MGRWGVGCLVAGDTRINRRIMGGGVRNLPKGVKVAGVNSGIKRVLRGYVKGVLGKLPTEKTPI